MKNLLPMLVLGFMSVLVPVQAADTLQAFPPAEPGWVRHVLTLPKEVQEDNLKVELLVGQTVAVDERNRYFFAGNIEPESIKGWGYTRYLVKALGPMAGTRMAVDPATPKRPRFITLGGEPYLIRYNSRLPVVVYVPAEAEVRYRIWRADGAMKVVEKG